MWRRSSSRAPGTAPDMAGDSSPSATPGSRPCRVELARSYVISEPKNALQVLDDAPKQQKQILAIILERNWALMGMQNTKEARTNLDGALRLGRFPELVLQDGVLKLIEKDYDGARAAANEV